MIRVKSVCVTRAWSSAEIKNVAGWGSEWELWWQKPQCWCELSDPLRDSWQPTVYQPQMYSNSKHATWRRSLWAETPPHLDTHPHTHTPDILCKSNKCTSAPIPRDAIIHSSTAIWAAANLKTKLHGASCKKQIYKKFSLNWFTAPKVGIQRG